MKEIKAEVIAPRQRVPEIEVQAVEAPKKARRRRKITMHMLFIWTCITTGIFFDLYLDANVSSINQSDIRGYINVLIMIAVSWIVYSVLIVARNLAGWEDIED